MEPGRTWNIDQEDAGYWKYLGDKDRRLYLKEVRARLNDPGTVEQALGWLLHKKCKMVFDAFNNKWGDPRKEAEKALATKSSEAYRLLGDPDDVIADPTPSSDEKAIRDLSPASVIGSNATGPDELSGVTDASMKAIEDALLLPLKLTGPLDEDNVKTIATKPNKLGALFEQLRELRQENRTEVVRYLAQHPYLKKEFGKWIETEPGASSIEGSSPEYKSHKNKKGTLASVVHVPIKRETGSRLTDAECMKLTKTHKFENKSYDPAVVIIAVAAKIVPELITHGLSDREFKRFISETERTQVLKAVVQADQKVISLICKDRKGRRYGNFRDSLQTYAAKKGSGTVQEKVMKALKDIE
jgi:hypothetical protein